MNRGIYIPVAAVLLYSMVRLLVVEPPPVGYFGVGDYPHKGYVAPEPSGPLMTPSGKVVLPGSVDEGGWVLPLDVRRPKTASSTAPRERPSATVALPATSAFEEHRLNVLDGHTQNETSIAVAGDTLIAGWNNYTATGLVMGVARSIDGGHVWSNSLLTGHSVMSDPAVSAGGNGKFYYAYLAGGGSGGADIDLYVRRTLDGGASWGAPALVTNNTVFDDKPYIDARGDEVLIGWADFGSSPSKVRAARSIDGGLTYQHDQIVSVNSGNGNGACPVIDGAGIYYMFWRDSFQESLWVARSTDQGATWSSDRGIAAMDPLPTSLPGGFRIVNLPSADADPLSGTIVVVWNDQALGNADILSVRSTDGGLTWSSPVRVNDDVGTSSQWFPWISFDGTGIAHVVWYDRRHDATDIDVYYSRSTDGGLTFEPNTRITANSFTPVLPWDTAVNFIGDYNGIAATATAAYPFYQDSRAGDQDVWVSIVPNPATGVPGSVPGPDSRLAASPTPFREKTVLHGERADAGREVRIVNVAGRTVRTLLLDGSGLAEWDGRTDDGRDAPPGVYLANLGTRAAPGVDRTARIVKIR